MFTKLFEPGMIGKIQLKNRMVMAPMGVHLAAEDGSVSDRLIDYYAQRTAG